MLRAAQSKPKQKMLQKIERASHFYSDQQNHPATAASAPTSAKKAKNTLSETETKKRSLCGVAFFPN